MQYKLHLKLQQRPALKIAISFWERKEVKDKAAKVFESCDEFWVGKARQEWREFTKTVVDEWNEDEFPHILKAELIHLVRMIGQTVFEWYQYIKYEYGAAGDATSFIDKIKWTHYGTVDIVETFQSSWLEHPNLDITEVYKFACRYAITDHINDLWKKIPRDIQNNCHKNIYKQLDQHILAYWKHYRDNDLPNLMGHFRVVANNFNEGEVFNHLYDLNRSTEENMLRLTVCQGYFNAMKYFWEKLTEQERKESVLKCARIAVLRWGHYADKHENTSDYKMCQCLEICIFLINQMTNQDKKLFFNENVVLKLDILQWQESDVRSRILGILLATWPWEELFMPILEDILQCRDDDNKVGCKLLDAIIFFICEDHELGYSLQYSKYRFLLREAWLIIPAPIKQKIVQENPYCGLTSYLISVWDLDNLNLIINDPAIADVRDQFIDIGSFSYEKLVANDQFEKLDQLISELFKFDEEQKKSFKQKINPCNKIFENHEFNVADKFLFWQSNIPEERQSIKKNINHIKVCEKFINYYNFTALDKFLDWKFETLEERIRCEDHFKNDIFVIKKV